MNKEKQRKFCHPDLHNNASRVIGTSVLPSFKTDQKQFSWTQFHVVWHREVWCDCQIMLVNTGIEHVSLLSW